MALPDKRSCLLLADRLPAELCAFEQADHLGCDGVSLVGESGQLILEVDVHAVIRRAAAFDSAGRRLERREAELSDCCVDLLVDASDLVEAGPSRRGRPGPALENLGESAAVVAVV